VENEKKGKGNFHKMKPLAKANMCRMREGEREPFTKSKLGQNEPVQNERRGKGSFQKMKTCLRRTCAEREKGQGKIS
jgi:hypothetical protein